MEEDDTLNGLILHRYFARRDPLTDRASLTASLTGKLAEMLKCPICSNIMSVPVFTKNCLHRFCRNCIEPEIRSRKQCQVCHAMISSHR